MSDSLRVKYLRVSIVVLVETFIILFNRSAIAFPFYSNGSTHYHRRRPLYDHDAAPRAQPPGYPAQLALGRLESAFGLDAYVL